MHAVPLLDPVELKPKVITTNKSMTIELFIFFGCLLSFNTGTICGMTSAVLMV